MTTNKFIKLFLDLEYQIKDIFSMNQEGKLIYSFSFLNYYQLSYETKKKASYAPKFIIVIKEK